MSPLRYQVFSTAVRYLQGGCDALRITGHSDKVGSWLYGFGLDSVDRVWAPTTMTEDLHALLHGIMDDLRVPREERDLLLAHLPKRK